MMISMRCRKKHRKWLRIQKIRRS